MRKRAQPEPNRGTFVGAIPLGIGTLLAFIASFLPRIRSSPLTGSASVALFDSLVVGCLLLLVGLLFVRKTAFGSLAVKYGLWGASLLTQIAVGFGANSDAANRVIQVLSFFSGIALPILVGLHHAQTAGLSQRKPAAASNAHRGFTLVEVLVVLAIITILAALILTGLTAARKEARLTDLAARGQQVNLALSLYAQANDERYGSLDLGSLVEAGLAPAEILVDPGDPLPRGFGGQQLWCRQEPRREVARHSFEVPLMQGDLNKSKTYLEGLGSNFGLIALRTQGDRDASVTSECGIDMAYAGRFLRFTVEGSVLRRTLRFDQIGGRQNFCPWDLFTDERQTCSYRMK